MRNYYETLGVTKISTTKEIKKKYYHLALQYHPDKNTEKSNSTERFKLLSEAYSTLSNPKKRFLYDIHLLFHLEPGMIDFTDEDLELIHNYYVAIIHSSEYKLLITLVSSLPKTFRRNIYEKFSKKCIPSTILISLNDIKYIDISQVTSDYTLQLVKKIKDLYLLNSHELILYNHPHGIYYHLFITEYDYVITLQNYQCRLKVQVSLEDQSHFVLDDYNLYYQNNYNLYQHYFVKNYFLSLPNTETILFDSSTHMIAKKGLYNPELKQRGNLYFNHKLHLSVKDINQYEEIIREIFHKPIE